MLNTFNGWKLQGRSVLFGEKGLRRNEYGDYLFHINQTCPTHLGRKVYRDNVGRPYRREYI